MKIEQQRAPRRRLALRRWVPYTLLAVGSLLTVIASWYVSSTAEAAVRAKFLTDAEQVRYRIQASLNTHFDVVRAGAALLSASNEINVADFRAFVAGLQLPKRYPGMQGIGFSAHVVQANLSSFLRSARLDGLSRLRVWPPGERAEYHPVVFMEPRLDQRDSTIGFDMSTDPVLVAAMERARDTGLPAASGKLTATLPFEPGERGIVLMVPIYPLRARVNTVNERRRALVGFVFSPVRSDDLLAQSIGFTTPAIAFDVYDGGRATPAALLHESGSPGDRDGDRSAEVVQVAGRDWLIDVRSVLPRSSSVAHLDRGTLLGGSLLSLVLFVVTRAQVRDLQTAARHQAELRASAQHDSLTKLPNRALLGDHLTRAIVSARRRGNHVAVLFLDLDRFKHINDSLGHTVGDQLLQSVATRLRTCVRGSDTVSRQGGDEFVLLLTEIDHADDAAAKAQEMITAISAPHQLAGHTIHVTMSVGISLYPDDGVDASTLLQTADTAMYQAKERGRNNYQFFKPDMNARVVERRWIEAGLRRALDHREFVLHYQPKISFETGEITGAEALIRWMSPERGLVGPTEFVPIAEDCGLIVPIGRWVLREACTQARAWLDAGVPVVVAINISALEFRDKDFLKNLQRVLTETRLAPEYLELELTESSLMQYADSSVSLLQALKDLGVTIALDDFGTGYSSLSYLRQFPIDVLKVDQSFVHEIRSGLDGSPIVSAIISMGKSLRHRVIAEGVETEGQFTFLQERRCGEGQGFYFSRPVVAHEFANLLRA